MIVGRREDLNTIIMKHKMDAEEQLKSWESELELAQNKGNEEYQKYENYCRYMIEVWTNTLNKLNDML